MKFRYGDIVKVTEQTSFFLNLVGKVISKQTTGSWVSYTIQPLDGSANITFHEDRLELK